MEAQLNQASQAEPPCQRRFFMLNPWAVSSSSSPLPSTSCSSSSFKVLLLRDTMASSACFCGNIFSLCSPSFLLPSLLSEAGSVQVQDGEKKEQRGKSLSEIHTGRITANRKEESRKEDPIPGRKAVDLIQITFIQERRPQRLHEQPKNERKQKENPRESNL